MDWQWFLPILLYAFSVTITPGPNNLMVTASGVNYGYWRTVPHILGIFLGFTLLNIAISSGMGAVLLALPQLHWALKIAGSLYLFWLAWKIATAAPASATDAKSEPIKWWQAALFQVVNPKAWTMCITAVSAFSLPGDAFVKSAVAIVVAFALVSVPCVSFWALMGAQLRKALTRNSFRRWFNGGLATLTAGSVVFILF